MLSILDPRPLRRLTVDEVMQMVDAGIFREDERVELIEGELHIMSPKGPLHGVLCGALHGRLAQALVGRLHVRKEEAIVAQPNGLPEPDLAVARGARRDFLARHPTGAETLLVVEVAISSLAEDLAKAATYARSGVPVYWIVDVEHQQVHVHEGPLPTGTWRSVRVLEAGELDVPGTSERWSVDSVLAGESLD